MTEDARWVAIRRVSIGVVVLTLATLHALDPAPEGVLRPLSAYALGRYPTLWRVGVLAAALAALGAGRGARAVTKRFSLFCCSGALVLIALFPTDPWYPWQRRLTIVGAVHWSGVVGVTASVVLGMLSQRPGWFRRTGGDAWPGRRSGAAFLAAATIVATCVLLSLDRRDWVLLHIGAAERVLAALALAWLWPGTVWR